MRTIVLFILLFISMLGTAQGQAEVEIGGGAYGLYPINLWGQENPKGIQVQLDYDFLNGPFRASIGLSAIALSENAFLQPGVKIGADLINITISKMPYGLTFYGLSSRVGFGSGKRHGMNFSVQLSETGQFIYSHGVLTVGYSFRI